MRRTLFTAALMEFWIMATANAGELMPWDPSLARSFTYEDPRTSITFYVESDGKHVAAIDAQGKLLWVRSPLKELDPSDTRIPVIDGFRSRRPGSHKAGGYGRPISARSGHWKSVRMTVRGQSPGRIIRLSPIVEFILDFMAGGLGGVSTKRPAPFPEGETNASLGAVAAFAGTLSALFALALLVITALGAGLSSRDYAGLVAASIVVAILALGGRSAGSRALQVTQRNRWLARLGRAVATLALGMSCVSIGFGVFWLVRHGA